MDPLISGAVFLLMLIGAVLAVRGRGDARHSNDELLRRMTPSLTDQDDTANLSITRETRVKQGQIFKTFYRTHPGQWLEENIRQAGLYLSVAEMLLIVLLMTLCGAALGELLFQSSLFSLAGAGGFGMLPLVFLKMRKQRRLKAFGDQLPFALDLMKSSLEAGHSLGRGLQVVVQEFGEPLGPEFRTVLEQSRVGVPLARALEGLLKRVPDQDVSLLVTAVKVQTQVGSSLAAIIGRLGEIVRTRQRLRLQIRALTAQGRMSGIVVGLLPVVVLAVFHLIRPSYVDILFHDPMGLKILKTAIGLDVMAFLAIRKLLKVDY